MKKKVLIILILLVLVASLLLTSCTFVKVNKERQANQIMATVSLQYEGQNLELSVSRNELLSYVNYMIQIYAQYGMSYDVKELIQQGLDAMVNQKYLILQGMVYLLSVGDRQAAMYMNTDAYKAVYGTKITPEGVLTLAERYSTIATTNETFVGSIDTFKKEYEAEQREYLVTAAKEKLSGLFANGYTIVNDGDATNDGVRIYYYDETEKQYKEGLYQDSFMAKGEEEVVDYTKVYLQITLEKGTDKQTVDYPIASASMTTAVDSETKSENAYVSAKKVTVTYDEKVTAEDDEEEDSYKTHTATASFTLITPRTAKHEHASKGDSHDNDKDTRDVATIALEGSIFYRYYTEFDMTDAEQKEFVEAGAIFQHTYSAYADDAEKEAYRLFRDEKRNMYIGFDAANKTDPYNTLGYYYLSSFESAVISAVQHELKRAELKSNPISDTAIAAEYNILVQKQKEEYDVLSNIDQVKKFAEMIGTSLEKVYYVPIDALLASTYEVDGVEYKYADKNGDTVSIHMFYIAHILTKWTDTLSSDISKHLIDYSDEILREFKIRLLSELETVKSKIDYHEIESTEVEDAFYLDADGKLTLQGYADVLSEVLTALANAEIEGKTGAELVEVFKEYMIYFNDDSGEMSTAMGYFVAGGIDHNYDGDDFPNAAIEAYWKAYNAGVDPTGAYKNDNTIADFNALSGIAFSFTSYGIHLEMISFAPFYNIKLNSNGGLGVDFVIDMKGTTLGESIKTALESRVESNVYSNWTAQYEKEEITAASFKDNKKVKQLIKDLGL